MLAFNTFLYSQPADADDQHAEYEYTSFDKTELTLYPFVGRHTALLAPSPDLDESVLKAIVDAMDKTYDYYKDMTGMEPELSYNYDGRSTVAVVPKTCGYACGYPGSSGIELSQEAFNDLYNGILSDNTYHQAIFYEFGRNFWFYGDKLEYKEPDDTDCVVTGYAVFMRFLAMEKLGVSPAPFHDTDFGQFKAQVKGMIDRYLSDESLGWENTLKIGKAPDNPMDLGATDLFASFLFKLRDLFGDGFIERLWKESAKRPDAETTQDAVDNFILAASAAAGKNLTEKFSAEWRWPVSEKAKAEAGKRFGLP